MSTHWYSFPELAKMLHTNFKGCKNAHFKAWRLSDGLRYLGDDGIFPAIDEDGKRWEISQYECVNIDEMKELVPGFKSIFEKRVT